MTLELWILLRLVVAGVLGGLVGYERQTTGKQAGLRTHMLVAMGAALFASFNDLAMADLHHTPDDIPQRAQVQVQPLGTVQAVATGIGFLGAGTIFLGRRRVHGLTTAASIWGISAVGLAAGFDRYLLAGGATILMLVVLHGMIIFERPRPTRDSSPDDVNSET